MAEAALNLADWISLADIGEHMRQKNDGHRGLARADVQAALEAGCGLRLRWVGDDGREVCREFPKRDSWEDILVWAGLPQRLCVQLPPDERKGNLPYPYAYLLRADAVRRGLWSASESPQAKQQSEPRQSPPVTQPDEPAVRGKEPEPPRGEPVSPSEPDVGDQAGIVTAAIGTVESRPEKRNGTPKDIRPSKEDWAETYTANYIEAEKKAGREPTLTGLRQAALKDKKSGVRTQLDDAFHQQYEVKRGRRKKSAK